MLHVLTTSSCLISPRNPRISSCFRLQLKCPRSCTQRVFTYAPNTFQAPSKERCKYELISDPCSKPKYISILLWFDASFLLMCSCDDPVFIATWCWAGSCGNHSRTHDLQMCNICLCTSNSFGSSILLS
jgi:hypothetical protein